MIKTRFFLLTMIASLLAACSGNSDGLDAILSRADLYPAKIEGQQRWSMISTDGSAVLTDSFTLPPTVAIDGVFSVYKTQGGLAVYRLAADGTLQTIADGLRQAGVMNADRMPVCRPDSAISVIDAEGNTLFTLDELDGHNFNASGAYYCCGLLTVRDCGTNLWGAIDRDGRLAIEPEYDYLSVFNDGGYALALKEGKLCIVSSKGDCTVPEGDFEMATGNFVYGHAIAIRKPEGVRCVIDTKGHVATLGSSTVPLLLCRQGSIFINHLGELGVMGYNGDVALVPARRELLLPLNGSDCLLTSDGKTFAVIDAAGSTRGTFPAGTTRVESLFGGKGYAVIADSTVKLFTPDFKPLGNLRIKAFERRLSLSDIILSDRDTDHRLFNSADPGSDLPDWMEPDDEESESEN